MNIRLSRSRLAWVAAVAFPTIAAIALTIKIVLFDPNWPFKPGCIDPYGNFFLLEGAQTDVFRDGVATRSLASWMPHGYRVDTNGVYVSLLDFDDNAFLNETKKTIELLELTKMNALVTIAKYIEVKKSRGQFPPRPSDWRDIDCELIAAIAIR